MSAIHTSKTKIVSTNVGGNLHDVARYVTKFGLSDFFVTASSCGSNSTVLFRLPIDWPVDQRGPLPAKTSDGDAS